MHRRELWQLIIIHFKELIREPGVLFWGIGFPILMAWGLGIAFTGEKETRKDIAVIHYHSPGKLANFLEEHATRQIREDSSQVFSLTINDKVFGRNIFHFIPVNTEEAMTGIKRGNFQLILDNQGDSTVFQLDPANPEARLLQLQLSGLMGDKHTNDSFTSMNMVPLALKGTRYIDFLIPGLIAMGIMMACMWGMSWTIIERRKGNLLRRMMVTPMHRYNLLIGLMTARVTMNFAEAALLILFAWFYFDMQLQGSVIALLMVFVAGNIAFTGLAILTSSRTSNTEVGNGIINFVTMPMMVLSGIFFSYQNFPEWSIPFIQKLPLTILADSIRSIFNEGAGIRTVLDDTIILSVFGIITFVAGLRIFKWY
jgi:ABC-2 type transport system permease protein